LVYHNTSLLKDGRIKTQHRKKKFEQHGPHQKTVSNFPFKVTDADISWTSIYYITDFRMKYDYLPMQSVPIVVCLHF
jgi:hypothetical protein